MILLCALLVMGGESDQEQQWRDERLKALTSETGWLNVIGLYWLTEGENKFGTDQIYLSHCRNFRRCPMRGH